MSCTISNKYTRLIGFPASLIASLYQSNTLLVFIFFFRFFYAPIYCYFFRFRFRFLLFAFVCFSFCFFFLFFLFFFSVAMFVFNFCVCFFSQLFFSSCFCCCSFMFRFHSTFAVFFFCVSRGDARSLSFSADGLFLAMTTSGDTVEIVSPWARLFHKCSCSFMCDSFRSVRTPLLLRTPAGYKQQQQLLHCSSFLPPPHFPPHRPFRATYTPHTAAHSIRYSLNYTWYFILSYDMFHTSHFVIFYDACDVLGGYFCRFLLGFTSACSCLVYYPAGQIQPHFLLLLLSKGML